eukprot:s2757_g4.t1
MADDAGGSPGKFNLSAFKKSAEAAVLVGCWDDIKVPQELHDDLTDGFLTANSELDSVEKLGSEEQDQEADEVQDAEDEEAEQQEDDEKGEAE